MEEFVGSCVKALIFAVCGGRGQGVLAGYLGQDCYWCASFVDSLCNYIDIKRDHVESLN